MIAGFPEPSFNSPWKPDKRLLIRLSYSAMRNGEGVNAGLDLLDAGCFDGGKQGSGGGFLFSAQDHPRNHKLREGSGEQQHSADEGEHQHDDELEGVEDSDGNIRVRRDAERKNADYATHCHEDFDVPHHLRDMVERSPM